MENERNALVTLLVVGCYLIGITVFGSDHMQYDFCKSIIGECHGK